LQNTPIDIAPGVSDQSGSKAQEKSAIKEDGGYE
jgi:hypothetical protein